jgi:tRNA threonylcarbamoyladenosine biosynthesis protein TsaE
MGCVLFPFMVTSISHSPAETFVLGETWGRTARRGTLIGLCGDLGAGKTQLVKGLARGLGIETRVVSPTFALVNVYESGRLTLFHLDLYRLETPEAVLAAGLEDYLSPEGVSVIEWADRWFGKRPVSQSQVHAEMSGGTAHSLAVRDRVLRWVTIESINELERRISYEDLST